MDDTKDIATEKIGPNKYVVALVFILLIGGLGYGVYVLNDKYQGEPKPTTSETSTPSTTPSSTPTTQATPVGWSKYRNDEIGIEFQYPNEWGDIDVIINAGSTGYAFIGSFSVNKSLTFTVFTTDWTKPIGGPALYSYYSKNSDGTFNYLTPSGKQAAIFNSSKIISNEYYPEILVVNGDDARELEAQLLPDDVNRSEIESSYAFINLNYSYLSSPIRGIGFTYNPIDDEQLSDFELLLKSLKTYE